MKHRIIINGLRHHDFKGRLDELYKLAPGRRMAISIEHDNPKETDAVIVYWGKELVGYVRSAKTASSPTPSSRHRADVRCSAR